MQIKPHGIVYTQGPKEFQIFELLSKEEYSGEGYFYVQECLCIGNQNHTGLGGISKGSATKAHSASLQRLLHQRELPLSRHYPTPIHQQPPVPPATLPGQLGLRERENKGLVLLSRFETSFNAHSSSRTPCMETTSPFNFSLCHFCFLPLPSLPLPRMMILRAPLDVSISVCFMEQLHKCYSRGCTHHIFKPNYVGHHQPTETLPSQLKCPILVQ